MTDGPVNQPGAGRTDPNIFVFLSLYLLLLAFFILLNSISQHESTRTAAALGSIDATFKAPVATDLEARSLAHMPGLLAGETALQARLGRLFQANLPVSHAKVFRRDGRIEVSVPGDRIFLPGSASFRTSRWTLFEALAEALMARSAAGEFELEILIETAANDGTETRARVDMARAAAIAADLTSRGVPSRRLATGLEPGTAGRIRFAFLPYQAGRGIDVGGPAEVGS